MAGIGFELKKVFREKGVIAFVRSYSYSGIICIGPMLLGMLFIAGVRLIGMGAVEDESMLDLVNSLLTYTLLLSISLVNLFSMVTNRFLSDCTYQNEESRVIPSVIGSISILLAIFLPLYGIFLLASGVSGLVFLLTMLFFGELIIVWSEMNYLMAIKDYKGILFTFPAAMGVAFLLGFFLSYLLPMIPITISMLVAICVGYAMIAVRYYSLLIYHFPMRNGSSFYFLRYLELAPELMPQGLMISIGLFSHLVIMWFSPSRKVVQGFLFETPIYDVPALVAFFSILITSINFTTSVEVEFYPEYRNFFHLLNNGGSITELDIANKAMEGTLVRELTNTFMTQFFSTLIFLVGGTIILPSLPLGFTDNMLGIFRILCSGYGFYAAGNCMMLLLMYFADQKGALFCTTVFAAVSTVGTWITAFMGSRWYGFGFLIGGFVFFILTLLRLRYMLKTVMEHILAHQPIIAVEKKGFFVRISDQFEERAQKRSLQMRRQRRESKSGKRKAASK